MDNVYPPRKGWSTRMGISKPDPESVSPFVFPPEDDESGLVLKFVAVESVGGPFDDEAYCAGFEVGKLDSYLELIDQPAFACAVQTANVAQVDLIAMRHGYLFDSVDMGEGWSWATLTKPGVIVEYEEEDEDE